MQNKRRVDYLKCMSSILQFVKWATYILETVAILQFILILFIPVELIFKFQKQTKDHTTIKMDKGWFDFGRGWDQLLYALNVVCFDTDISHAFKPDYPLNVSGRLILFPVVQLDLTYIINKFQIYIIIIWIILKDNVSYL